MPWQECNQMDERLKFIARLLDGEKMAAVCRDFSISRKTGYKILKRYNEVGLEGLTDRSRRPYRHANQLPVQIETLIVRCKQDKPHWGAIGSAVVTILRIALAQAKTDYVFPSIKAQNRPFVGLPKAWKRIVGARLDGLTPHGLRHAFASSAEDLGFTMPTIKVLLGHSMGGVTAGYIHKADSVLIGAADLIANHISSAMAGQVKDKSNAVVALKIA